MVNQGKGSIPANLDKIGKRKRKFLMKRMKDVDPSKLEQLLKESKHDNKELAFKNKKKKKSQDKKLQSKEKRNLHTLTLPKETDKFSSNWKTLESTARKEESVTKEKQLFYRRNKSGQLITNDPSLEDKKEVKDSKSPHSDTVLEEDSASEVWFDDVDPMLLESGKEPVSVDSVPDALVKSNSFTGITKVLGMDCEMVGVGTDGVDSILARVSIVNHFGNPVYDKFVKPREKVTDYRTAVSGVRPEDLVGAPEFTEVQAEVAEMIKGRLLVGHALNHDMKVLFLDHPKKMIRDTSKYKPFKNAFGGRTPSLKNLSARFLGVTVQTGEHSSVQDSQAAVRLYTMFRKEWEAARQAKVVNKANSKKASEGGKKVKKGDQQRFQVTKSDIKGDGGDKRALYCPSDSD